MIFLLCCQVNVTFFAKEARRKTSLKMYVNLICSPELRQVKGLGRSRVKLYVRFVVYRCSKGFDCSVCFPAKMALKSGNEENNFLSVNIEKNRCNKLQ